MTMNDENMTVKTAGALLGVSRGTLYRYVATKKISHFKFDGKKSRIRFSPTHISEFLHRHERPAVFSHN